MPALLSLLLYAATAFALGGAAAWLRRPLPARIFLAFLVLPVLFLLPAFVGGKTIFPVDHAMSLPPWNSVPHDPPANPNLNDVATQMAPWAKAVRLAWKEGSLPWRGRWNACGTPLAANGQSAAFSPLAFLLMAVPLANAFNLAAAVKLFAALAGMWLWLSELRLSRGAALFGAALFAFSFTMVPWLLFPHTSVIALWPWALFAIERTREPGSRGPATAALVVILALQLLAGHPESVVLEALFAAIWLGARALARDLGEPRRIFGAAAFAALVAVGSTAFLLAPHVLAIRDSNRAVTALDFSKRLSVRLAPHAPGWTYGLFTAIQPRSLGDAMASPMLPIAAGSFPEMALGHFGVAGWACALLLFRRGFRRPRAELALLAPLLAGFATAILLWPIFELFFVIPGVQLMLPLRFFTWVALAGSALAAFEIDRLEKDIEAGRASGLALLWSAGVVLALAAVPFWRLAPFRSSVGALVPQRRELAFAAAALLALGSIGAAFSRKSIRAPVLAMLVALVAAAELFAQGIRLYRFGSPVQFYPPTLLVEFLRRQPRPFRIVGEGPVFYPGVNVFAGLEDVRIHDPVERREYVELLDAACGYDPSTYFKHVGDVNCALLDFLNVKYLVAAPNREAPGPKWRLVYSGKDGTVFENEHSMGRIFAPHRIRTAKGGENIRDFASLDWLHEAIVVIDPARGFPASETASNGAVRVSDYRERTNSASFRAQTPPAGAVVVASLVQDGGWTARDESGSTLSTSRANGPFLAIALRGGDHRIRLTYAPPGSKAGALVSLATLAFLGLVLARRHRAPSSKSGHL
jgi:hypothetical protein